MYDEKIRALRMERQHLLTPANETEYDALYRDLQPGQNVYWNGFGQPPTLSFRADFDDLVYNKSRQFRRELIKGRFAGGNLGWILPEDLELFAALYRKPLKNATMTQQMLLERIEMSGPYTIGQLKEESGLLVKEITPALHRLQEAFLIYEDQYDGEWDRGWYRFGEFFSDFSLDRYTKTEALKIVLRRFAHRFFLFRNGYGFGRAKAHAHGFVAPDLFERVVLADGRLHDVDDGRAAVDDDPLAVFFALDARLGKTGFAHRVAHAGGQRLGLAVAGAAGDDDALKQRREMLRIKNLNVLRLDVFEAVHNGALQFLGVFFGGGFRSHRVINRVGGVQYTAPRQAAQGFAARPAAGRAGAGYAVAAPGEWRWS